MKKPTPKETIEAVKEINLAEMYDVLDILLDRMYKRKEYTISRLVDGHVFHIECLNPHSRFVFTKD